MVRLKALCGELPPSGYKGGLLSIRGDDELMRVLNNISNVLDDIYSCHLQVQSLESPREESWGVRMSDSWGTATYNSLVRRVQ